ncbi:MAG: excinuclease ABC subunit UvrB [Clostridiales bacterium]|nr:excinuclease ABC subunit UvrB [Clostridiales bacterium]MDD6342135.1 excinuclease ABC subunit UvrB [Eubacteriales bacterium]
MDKFKLVSNYKPTGDQPQAIAKLTEGVLEGADKQTLLGVTGSGKTFTMANIIANVNRPTLVLAHNKTLAAQLCSEFREFFPENAVEYFVSYYDYYQPEAYIAHTDTYIEKDMSINDEIDRLRHSATSALFERRDVIIVASVSCIYTLGDPAEYHDMMVSLRVGQKLDREKLLKDLAKIRFERNDIDLGRGMFRARGDVVEIFPASANDLVIRVEFWDDEIERICEVNPTTGELLRVINYAVIFPAVHYVTTDEHMKKAIDEIIREMEEREKYFTERGKLIEAQRIRERTMYDVEFLRTVGYCKGVENYSRILSGRKPGSTPYTLLDYFPKDFLMFIDESHVSVPQVRGMSGGDRARKESLVEYGFRLPSAFDNRPLFFDEFEKKINQVIYVSATPGDYEKEHSKQIVEQIIRPTGLLDPLVSVRPTDGQIDDLVSEIKKRVEKKERVLVVTLTKKMSESLTEYLQGLDLRVRYMHHETETLERVQTLRDLRMGEFDVLVGINLLREGLDLPEVSLIAILDADKEGFLRNERSLIQIIGRAARNAEGEVIMYADTVTPSMESAIKETERRRSIQEQYNKEHGIIPKTIIKPITEVAAFTAAEKVVEDAKKDVDAKKLSPKQLDDLIKELSAEMKRAAKNLDFEYAATLRDRIKQIQAQSRDAK